MSISCNNCGEEWPRDPRLEVACPTCQAPVGQKCRRPSEHEAPPTAYTQGRAGDSGGILKQVLSSNK